MTTQQTTIITVTAGQQALISGVRNENTLFTFGSVEAYTLENNASLAKWNSPIPQTPVEDALANARRRGHELAWAIPESCCIVDTNRYPGYYAARQAKLDAALKLSAGDMVQIEGRTYRLTPAPNNNVSLEPVAA